MKTRDLLAIIPKGTVVQVHQKPIKRIDPCEADVCRQDGEVEVLYRSNQNYLDFDVICLKQTAGIIDIICQANHEQEQVIINALYEGR